MNVPSIRDEKKLHELTDKLLKIMAEHTSDSVEVRNFVKENREVQGFESLARTLILLREGV